MVYPIAAPCVELVGRECVEEYPVDCIDDDVRALVSSPMSASTAAHGSRRARWRRSSTRTTCPRRGRRSPADNARFCTDVLPGARQALGCPGRPGKAGAVDVDTALMAGYPQPDREPPV